MALCCPFISQEKHLPGFFCDYCQKGYQRKTRLAKHILSMHLPQHPINLPVCASCHTVFANEQLANLHIRSKHETKITSNDTGSDNKPLDFKLIEQVFMCEYCESAFQSVELLFEHKRLEHTPSDGLPLFECVHCAQKFDQYGKLKTHYNSHVELKTMFSVPCWFCCEFCPKQFRTWRSVQLHRKNIHLSGVSVIECPVCGRGFHKIVDFEYHNKLVHETRFECPLCEQSFNSKTSMQNHLTSVHIEENHKKRRRSQRKHMAKSESALRTRDTIVVHLCPVCKQEFRRKQELKEHYAKVSNVGYTCFNYTTYYIYKKFIKCVFSQHLELNSFESDTQEQRFCSKHELTIHER